MKKPKKYIIHDGYIGVFIRYEHGIPIYRFPGGDCIGTETEIGFDAREEAEKYAMERYGHAD